MSRISRTGLNETGAGDEQPADDHDAAQRSPEQPPRLYRDHGEAIGVHQRHEDAEEKVVDRREHDQREHAGDAADDCDRAPQVHAVARAVGGRTAHLVGKPHEGEVDDGDGEHGEGQDEHAEHAARPHEQPADHRGHQERDPCGRADQPVRPVALPLGHAVTIGRAMVRRLPVIMPAIRSTTSTQSRRPAGSVNSSAAW